MLDDEKRTGGGARKTKTKRWVRHICFTFLAPLKLCIPSSGISIYLLLSVSRFGFSTRLFMPSLPHSLSALPYFLWHLNAGDNKNWHGLWLLHFRRTWYGRKITIVVDDNLEGIPEPRPTMLYAPVYNGLAAGLSLCEYMLFGLSPVRRRLQYVFRLSWLVLWSLFCSGRKTCWQHLMLF